MKKEKNNLAEYLFHKGENYHSYEFLGSFKTKNGVIFRVWAPNATKVFVTGDFNGWNYTEYEMKKINTNGIYEMEIKNVEDYSAYKYCIYTKDGRTLLKSDPYARHFETRPNTASKVYFSKKFNWSDSNYLKNRKISYNKGMNIYEVHLASWKTYKDGKYFNYRKIADELSDYCVKMNYTHIEILPIMEHPYDKSWGYQVTGYFAPTSRYGTPEDFKYFVDTFHKKNIGVIMDWVPGHFPKDDFGLYEFDGQSLYEYGNSFKQEHKTWGTRVFDYGRNEVISFLISSAVYWIKEFHIDGLRVDAVSSMLYLNYDRKDGEWQTNQFGGNGNLEAVEFLKKLNYYINKTFKNVMMIAEESTDWPKITKSTSEDGLGFTFKWNMGWMNDSLSYYKEDPFFRKYKQDKITFPLMYAFNENYILPISHDEVVHGKKSLLDKAYTNYEDKFSNIKTFLGYMYSQPGKKLLFMGSEFGQFIEWNEEKELDWLLLDYENHKKLHRFTKDLNKIYIENSELWEDDYGWDGFRWHINDDFDNDVFVYSRIDKNKNEILVILNFSKQTLKKYKIGVDKFTTYKLLISSDYKMYGGKGNKNYVLYSKNKPYHNFENYIELNIPEFSVMYFKKINNL